MCIRDRFLILQSVNVKVRDALLEVWPVHELELPLEGITLFPALNEWLKVLCIHGLMLSLIHISHC